MSSKQIKSIIQDINNRKISPIYLLQGDESFYLDQVADYIEKNLLSESEKAFNQTVAYGKDTEPEQVLDALRRYPMGAEYQVFILKEAQEFKAKHWDVLLPYLEKPSPTSVFVVLHKHKNIDKRSRAYKAFKKNAVVFETKKVYESQVPAFINERAAHYKLHFEYKASMLLSEYLGSDLSKIDREIQKIAANCGEGSRVGEADIERLVGISKDFNVFELTKALVDGNGTKAFQIVKYFIANPKNNHPLMVIGALYSFFSKAYVYQHIQNLPDNEAQRALKTFPKVLNDIKTFVKNYSMHEAEGIMEVLQEYDLKFKGVDGGENKEALLIEMIYKIIHPDRSIGNYRATG